MKYEVYLKMRKSYRSSLKKALLALGQHLYGVIKIATESVSNTPVNEPKYGIRDPGQVNFNFNHEVQIYSEKLYNLEMEAVDGFGYTRPGSSLINNLFPRLSESQRDIRRSEFKKYTSYPRKTAVGSAISLVVLGIIALFSLPFLVYLSPFGALLKVGGSSSSSPPPPGWSGAFGALVIGLGLYLLYHTIENRSKKAGWKLNSTWLKRYFLGTRLMHWRQKLQVVAVFSLVSILNILSFAWIFPGRMLFAIVLMVINQKSFTKTGNETEAFVVAWRFGLTFIFTIQICLSIVSVFYGIRLIVAP